MVNLFSQNRRLLLSILQIPARLPLPYSQARAISKPFSILAHHSNNNRSVSFGAEVDAALAPFLDELAGDETKDGKPSRKRSRTKKAASKKEDTVAANPSSRIQSKLVKSTEAKQQDAVVHRARQPEEEQSIEGRSDRNLHYVQDTETSNSASTTYSQTSDEMQDVQEENRRNAVNEESQRASKSSKEGLDKQMRSNDPTPQWRVQKEALKRKFEGQTWNPRKKLSPDAMEGIRKLHEEDPERYSTPALSQAFKVSPEAVRRILKSKWRPSQDEMQERRERWAKRYDRIWDQQSELGLRPKRGRRRRPEEPDEFEQDVAKKEALGEI